MRNNLAPVVAKWLRNNIIGLDDFSKLFLVAANDDDGCLGIIVVLVIAFIYFGGLFKIFENELCFLEVFVIIGLIITDFSEELAEQY